MPLKLKVIGSYIFIFLAIVIIVLFSTMRSNSSLKAISFMRSNIAVSVSAMKQIKVDIIQIQNWLTDTAFTGYLSGFDTAEKYYKDANILIDEDIVRKNEAGKIKLVEDLIIT